MSIINVNSFCYFEETLLTGQFNSILQGGVVLPCAIYGSKTSETQASQNNRGDTFLQAQLLANTSSLILQNLTSDEQKQLYGSSTYTII